MDREGTETRDKKRKTSLSKSIKTWQMFWVVGRPSIDKVAVPWEGKGDNSLYFINRIITRAEYKRQRNFEPSLQSSDFRGRHKTLLMPSSIPICNVLSSGVGGGGGVSPIHIKRLKSYSHNNLS